MCKEFIFYEFLKIETLELNLSFIIWNSAVKKGNKWSEVKRWLIVSLFIFYFCRKVKFWSFWGLCGTLSHGLWKLQLSWLLHLPMEEWVLNFCISIYWKAYCFQITIIQAYYFSFDTFFIFLFSLPRVISQLGTSFVG